MDMETNILWAIIWIYFVQRYQWENWLQWTISLLNPNNIYSFQQLKKRKLIEILCYYSPQWILYNLTSLKNNIMVKRCWITLIQRLNQWKRIRVDIKVLMLLQSNKIKLWKLYFFLYPQHLLKSEHSYSRCHQLGKCFTILPIIS